MTGLVVAVAVVVVAGLRVWMRQRRRRRARASAPGPVAPRSTSATRWAGGAALGDVGLVALREIRERVRGRIFRVGTIFILLGVGAAILIPKITSGGTPPAQRVGVVGSASPTLSAVVVASGRETATGVRLVTEPSVAVAKAALHSGAIDLVVVDGRRIVVNQAPGQKADSTTETLAQALARNLGILRAYEDAGLSGAQITQLAHAHPVAIENLQGGSSKGATQSTSVIGIVLLFLMLTQYNTWILMGVMQEKASRVVEVLLATVRPIQLLGGKVLGIGLVAMGQAALIVSFALVLGYAFYCWVYAAAGSMAERQDQVQTLVLPLTIPIIVGYSCAITAASTGHASPFFHVLAYLPPTAPFAMPVLVGLGDVTIWGFFASVVITLAGTVVMARVAAGVYRRAVLRSGQRVRLRDLTGSPRRREPMVTS